jgi:hypothetical protein
MPMSPRLLRPRASGGFDPRSIANLELWLDFGDASTVTLSGSQITSVNDKSGKGRVAEQTVANNRPLIVNNAINGRAVASFDGTNDSLTIASFPEITQFTAFAVAYRDWSSRTLYRFLFSQSYTSASSATAGIACLAHTPSVFADWLANDFITLGNGFTAGRAPRSIGPLGTRTDGAPLVMSATLSSSLSGQWVNGTAISTRVNTTGAVNCASGTMHICNSTTGDFADYKIGEMLVYLRDLSTSERQAVDLYLTRRYAIT